MPAKTPTRTPSPMLNKILLATKDVASLPPSNPPNAPLELIELEKYGSIREIMIPRIAPAAAPKAPISKDSLKKILNT